MSNSPYETYETYETYEPHEAYEPCEPYEPYETYAPAYADPVYGGFDAPSADLHSAETLGNGTPGAPGARADTYRPAYETRTLPGLPRQNPGGPDEPGAAQDAVRGEEREPEAARGVHQHV
ncbi:hypothetical protein ACWDQ0_22655, partial [Streptomyces sp. NPDC003642]